jgi:hypothetical protein
MNKKQMGVKRARLNEWELRFAFAQHESLV